MAWLKLTFPPTRCPQCQQPLTERRYAEGLFWVCDPCDLAALVVAMAEPSQSIKPRTLAISDGELDELGRLLRCN